MYTTVIGRKLRDGVDAVSRMDLAQTDCREPSESGCDWGAIFYAVSFAKQLPDSSDIAPSQYLFSWVRCAPQLPYCGPLARKGKRSPNYSRTIGAQNEPIHNLPVVDRHSCWVDTSGDKRRFCPPVIYDKLDPAMHLDKRLLDDGLTVYPTPE